MRKTVATAAAAVALAATLAWQSVRDGRADSTAVEGTIAAPSPAVAPTPVDAVDATPLAAALPVEPSAPIVAVLPPSPSPRADVATTREPAVPPAAVAAIDPAAAQAAEFSSRDGRITFRVPQPSDAEWTDYQAMLQHPRYRSSGTGSAGFALPYDPEWRAVERGRREAPAVAVTLDNTSPRIDDLATAILDALQNRDAARLLALHVTHDEFLNLCWPEFPQSRPYLKIPEAEAWSFQQTKCTEGAASALRGFGGRAWVLQGVDRRHSTTYRNFILHEGVSIRAIDSSTGNIEVLDIAPVVVERDGRFKVFVFGE